MKLKRPIIRDTHNSLAYVPLGKTIAHGFAIVDLDDADYIQQHNWSTDTNGYARRFLTGGGLKGGYVYMHQELCPVREGFTVDHVNRNNQDNRRNNLREATMHEQMMNRSLHSRKTKDRTSIYKGVCRVNKIKGKPWQYAIYSYDIVGGKLYGYTETEEEAAHIYNQLAEVWHGDRAVLNDIQWKN